MPGSRGFWRMANTPKFRLSFHTQRVSKSGRPPLQLIHQLSGASSVTRLNSATLCS